MPAAVPMSVADVRRPTDRPERHIVVLDEVGGERRLPIWIGTPEAQALVAVLEEVELPRPGPYHFAGALLHAAGGALREVRVSRLADSVFYATAVLEEVGGDRRLPIWIGMPEALSLVAALEEVELPRPGPYHFAQALLAAAGGALREVRVSRLADSVFYAVAVLADGSEVDARPSDALTLALVTGAPITVEPAVLDASEHFARERPGLAAEVSGPADSASVLADEVRARLADLAREVAELNEPPAEP